MKIPVAAAAESTVAVAVEDLVDFDFGSKNAAGVAAAGGASDESIGAAFVAVDDGDFQTPPVVAVAAFAAVEGKPALSTANTSKEQSYSRHLPPLV